MFKNNTITDRTDLKKLSFRFLTDNARIIEGGKKISCPLEKMT